MIITKNIPTLSGIYKFTNKINNKVYIGQAKNLKVRVNDHLRCYKKQNFYFYKAIQKHGVENFELEVLQKGKFTKTELNEMEITYIRLFKANNKLFGYNLTNGGDGGSGFKPSEETRKKLSESHKGHKHTEEQKQKISKGNLGKKMSQEAKDKISKNNKGKIFTNKHIENLKKSHTGLKQSQETIEKRKQTILNNGGFKHSEETKEKMKGHFVSNETKQKIGKLSKGRIVSEETRQKIRQANLGKKQSLELIEKRTRIQKFNRIVKYFQKNNWIYEWVI